MRLWTYIKSLNETFLVVVFIITVMVPLSFWFRANQLSTQQDKITQLKCPDEYPTFEESALAFDIFVEDYFSRNPNASIGDMSRARKDFYTSHGCINELARYEGNVNEETRRTVNEVIKEIFQ